MKPETTRGARRLVPRRRRGRAHADALGLHGDPSSDARGAGERVDFDPAEFAAFLEADDATTPADPAFRERLREELWGMIRTQADRRRPVGKPVEPLVDPKRRR